MKPKDIIQTRRIGSLSESMKNKTGEIIHIHPNEEYVSVILEGWTIPLRLYLGEFYVKEVKYV